MGLEPTTLRDLVGCSNHWATGDSMVSEGQFVGLDWNRIARLHSQVLVSTCENSLTASRCHIKAYQDAANQPPKWAYKDETIFFFYSGTLVALLTTTYDKYKVMVNEKRGH